MSLYTVSSGTTINAQDINQVVNVLQQQSGGQEIGVYFIAGCPFESSAVVAQYVNTISRGSAPVSVTIDTSRQSPISLNAPTTNILSRSGFQVYAFATGSANNARVGGNYTVQY